MKKALAIKILFLVIASLIILFVIIFLGGVSIENIAEKIFGEVQKRVDIRISR